MEFILQLIAFLELLVTTLGPLFAAFGFLRGIGG